MALEVFPSGTKLCFQLMNCRFIQWIDLEGSLLISADLFFPKSNKEEVLFHFQEA